MNSWKWGSLIGMLVLAAAAGAAVSPVARAQSRDSLVRLLEQGGHGTQIGVTVHDADADDTKSHGPVVVDDVREGSPAEKAGIKSGDGLLEFDGEHIRSAQQFTRLVQESQAGHGVPAVLSRNGQRVTVTVTPERRSIDDGFGMRLLETPYAYAPPAPPVPPVAPRAARPPAPPRPAMPFDFMQRTSGGRLGVTLESLTEGLNDYFGVKSGMLVRNVPPDSPAAKAGVKAGDVLTHVNGSSIEDASDVSSAIASLDEGAEVSIEIVRDKKPQTVKAKLTSRASRYRGDEWSDWVTRR